MAEDKQKLFAEFPPIATEEWMNKITEDLKGADFQKRLVWRTTEGFDVQPFYRKEDIDALRAQFNVTQLHYVAADGYTNHIRERVNEMDEDTYALYLKYHFATCERIDLSGYSNHTLDIFKKGAEE